MSKIKLLLVGAGGFGRTVAEQSLHKYDCAFIDDGCIIGTEICGIPVVGSTSDLAKLRNEYEYLVVSIGNNQVRKILYENAEKLGYSFPNIVAQNASISPYAKLGHGCVILQNVSIQNGATVGDGVLLNPGVEIHCDAAVGDYTLVYTNSVIRTKANVGSCVRIGSNTTICNEACIQEGTDIPDCTAVH